MVAPINPTALTPPRVDFIDPRTGAISREWFRFFLSLLTATEDTQGIVDTSFNSESLLASYESKFDDATQALAVEPRDELGTMAALQQANVPWMTFDNAPSPVSPFVGTVRWAGGTTLGVQMTADVLGRVNEDLFYYVKATATITKGQVVMFTGAVGASGVPTGAPATGVTDGAYIMGVAAEDIALNDFGLVQYNGTLKGINTSAFADGDILWYDPAVTGGLTDTVPTAPNPKVQMAAVINAGPGASGSILIRVNSGSTLGGTDSNVEISGLANGDLLQYDGAQSRWENVPSTSISVGTATNLAGGAADRIVYQTAPDTTGFIVAPTTPNTFLNWDGSVFQWSSNPLGTVTSVDVSGGTTGLTTTGGPITSSGTITLGGTLAVANGGTGANTLTANYLLKGNGTSAVQSSIAYDNGGALGVNTTAAAGRLQVALDTSFTWGGVWGLGAAVFGGAASSSGALGISYNDTDGAVIGAITPGTAWRNVSLFSDNLIFATNGSTERMRITTAGLVGIGTSSPATTLHLSSAAPRITLTDTTTGADTVLDGNSSVGSFDIRVDDNAEVAGSALRIFVDGTQHMVVAGTTGNVGVGTTSPRSRLDSFISGNFDPSNAAATAAMFARNSGTAGSGNYGGSISFSKPSDGFRPMGAISAIQTTADPDQGGLALFVHSSTTADDILSESMRIDASGNLMVATTTASSTSTLNGFVVSGATSALVSRRASGAAQNHASFVNNGVTVGTIVTSTTATTYNTSATSGVAGVDANTIALRTNSAERMRVTSAGEVGIATSTPAGRLHTQLATTFSWGGGWNTGVAAFGGGTSTAGALAISYNDTDGAALGAIEPGVAWRKVSVFSDLVDLCSNGTTSRLRVKSNGQVRFIPLASAPAGAEAGDVYYDSGTNKLRCYDGTVWNDLF
jgi:hypothetical protein